MFPLPLLREQEELSVGCRGERVSNGIELRRGAEEDEGADAPSLGLLGATAPRGLPLGVEAEPSLMRPLASPSARASLPSSPPTSPDAIDGGSAAQTQPTQLASPQPRPLVPPTHAATGPLRGDELHETYEHVSLLASLA